MNFSKIAQVNIVRPINLGKSRPRCAASVNTSTNLNPLCAAGVSVPVY